LNRRGAVLALLLSLLLLLGSACTADSEGGEPGEEDKKTEQKPDPECLAEDDIPTGVDAARPAIAIKVENDPAAWPQSGLDKADVVFEEIVEGGITRFMAIYHCGESKRVGPVRSARYDDPKIALPFTRVLAFSGSNSIVGRELKKRGMRTLVEGMKGTAFFRIPPGSPSVHSVFADTEKLRDFADKTNPPSREIFTLGEVPSGGKDAKSVKINFSQDSTIEYRWKKGSWQRFEGGQPFMIKGAGQLAVPNVLVQEVRVDNSTKIVDIEGNPSPDIKLVGTGRAVLFRDGQAVEGEWAIEKETKPPTFTTKDGDPFAFADGPIWVELVPSKKGNVKGSFSFK
jgi:hypothetical protein